MHRILAVLFFATILPLQVLAQEAPRAEIFGGFQYFRANSGGCSFTTGSGSCFDDFNLNGWNASLSGYFNRYVGVTADFSGAYGSPELLGIPIRTKFHTFMFGPVVRLPNPTHVTPFVHLLGGGTHVSADAEGVSDSSTDAAWAVGGGIDLNIAPSSVFAWGRLTFCKREPAGIVRTIFRYSAGIVLRF